MFPAHTRSKWLIDLFCSLIHLWDRDFILKVTSAPLHYLLGLRLSNGREYFAKTKFLNVTEVTKGALYLLFSNSFYVNSQVGL